MFDETPIAPETCHWTESLKRGDVVIYRFPLVAAEAGQIAKKRPCLVLDVFEQDGAPHARLAFGTSTMKRRFATDISLEHPADLSRAGMLEPTRFERGRSIAVPLDDAGFAVSSRLNTAVTGRVSEQVIKGVTPRRGHLRMQR